MVNKLSMFQRRKRQAFSLIELSIVILVIAILITGIIQARNIINKFQLQTARSLTNSSPTLSINGLELWLETTSLDSFSGAYPDNLDRISLWKDLNAQSATKNNATQSNSSLRPYFYENVINGLPGMYFAPGTNQILNGSYPINSKNSATGSFSFFLVAVSNESVNFQTAFDTGVWNNLGWAFNKLQSAYNNKLRLIFCFNANCPAYDTASFAPKDVIQIYSVTVDDSKKLWFYINGAQAYTATNLNVIPISTIGYKVGNDQAWINALGSGAWRGYIGEIIVYNRFLKADERKAIEKYLSQKWKVVI